ncbi:amino acid permease-like protein [Trypanosoma grayi]|uniref:amino acid permease-like protein n=1 Tax=Trypanosoma grayi TaxID=71804 RepID=UPI0004F497B2|nr:amino acid permease-like protein [Trypanosoma grayi]KEG14218.1 amino acid permease-like protein [Trypanosoma grayi]
MRSDVRVVPEERRCSLLPLTESTTLLTFLPIDSRRASMDVSLQHTTSVLSHSFSPYFQQRFFYISDGGMAASAFNLASSTLGAGTLALPYAVAHCGWVLSFFALMLCFISTVYSVYLLAAIMELTGCTTYEEMSNYCFGYLIEKITASIIILFCWGVAVVYVVVIGDILDSIVAALHLQQYIGRQGLLLLFWLFIMLPLSLARSINSLRYASLVGSMSTTVLVMAICLNAVGNGAKLTSVPLIKLEMETFSSFNTFVFSICCQSVVSKVYAEMQNRSPCNITKAATLSIGSCSFIYIVAGVFGAADFGVNTEPNIMHNYTNDLDKPYITLAFFAIALTVTMSFPMAIFPTRDSILIVLGYPEDNATTASVVVAAVLALLALILGMLVPNVRILFNVLGGVLGSFVSFIFPALFAIRCGFWNPKAVGWLHVGATGGLLILGAVSCALGVQSSFGIV